MKTEKLKYWNPTEILKRNADYNIIIGERSNGKTYGVQVYCIKDYWENKKRMAVIRRYDLDLRGRRAAAVFEAVCANGEVEKITKGKYTTIIYNSGRWYLANYDKKLDKYITEPNPFAYAFTLSSVEHDKSTSYPDVDNIHFDEFLTRGAYLPNEFVDFQNTLSTIIRERDGVKIFMTANTVNKYSPYISEMRLTNINKMNIGDIDVYEYEDTGLKIAVEYTTGISKNGKKSDKYFSFKNPKLAMITRGAWEIPSYPHLPFEYNKEDIVFKYFIIFEDNILQCEIIIKNECIFTYIHTKTTPIKDENNDIVFTKQYTPKPNYRRKVTSKVDLLNQKISWFFDNDKVFYQDNEVGEMVRNYLLWCKADRGII